MLVVVLALLVAADSGARRATEAQLERRIRSEVPSAESASVHIDSIPFLGRLLASGHVSRVRASASGVQVGRLRFARITVDLHDVDLDRDRLVLHRQVDLQGIASGTAQGEITQADLRRALNGVPLVLGDGRIGVQVAGVTAAVTVTLRDNVLRLSAGPLSIPPITLPKVPLLPCATQAAVVPGSLRLSCAVAAVPRELLRQFRGGSTPASLAAGDERMTGSVATATNA